MIAACIMELLYESSSWSWDIYLIDSWPAASVFCAACAVKLWNLSRGCQASVNVQIVCKMITVCIL